MLSKSADPSLATPSQAPKGEGVETGREPPDRVTAKVKAQSRPRTLAGERRRKPKWDGIRRVLVRAQEGQLRSGGCPLGHAPLLLEGIGLRLRLGPRTERIDAVRVAGGPIEPFL